MFKPLHQPGQRRALWTPGPQLPSLGPSDECSPLCLGKNLHHRTRISHGSSGISPLAGWQWGQQCAGGLVCQDVPAVRGTGHASSPSPEMCPQFGGTPTVLQHSGCFGGSCSTTGACGCRDHFAGLKRRCWRVDEPERRQLKANRSTLARHMFPGGLRHLWPSTQGAPGPPVLTRGDAGLGIKGKLWRRTRKNNYFQPHFFPPLFFFLFLPTE